VEEKGSSIIQYSHRSILLLSTTDRIGVVVSARSPSLLSYSKMPKFKSIFPEEYDAIRAKLKEWKADPDTVPKPKLHYNRRIDAFSLSDDDEEKLLKGGKELLVVSPESFLEADNYFVEFLMQKKRMATSEGTDNWIKVTANGILRKKYAFVPEEYYVHFRERLHELQAMSLTDPKLSQKLEEHDKTLEDHELRIKELEKCDDKTVVWLSAQADMLDDLKPLLPLLPLLPKVPQLLKLVEDDDEKEEDDDEKEEDDDEKEEDDDEKEEDDEGEKEEEAPAEAKAPAEAPAEAEAPPKAKAPPLGDKTNSAAAITGKKGADEEETE